MKAADLAEVIAAEKDELIARWRRRIRGTVDPSAIGWEALADSLPDYLDEIAAQLRAEGRPKVSAEQPTGKARAIAADHGTERFHAGFSLGAVIREYGALRDCVLDLLEERKLEIPIGDLKVVLSILNSGVVIAAEQFARERDQAIERQAHEHFGFIAHELRTPLASAVLAAQLLQRRGGASGDQLLQRLLRNLTVLKRLIDHSLSSARAHELGHSRALERAEVSLRTIVDDSKTEMAGAAEEKGLTVIVEGEARMQADARLIRSAVTNLLGNALKYTRPGGTVRVRVRTGENLASLEVEDECGGLPEGRIEELFTPFVQRGADRSGFGLGLAIAKDAVQAHQGNVQVSNLPGKGCVFMLSLPLMGPADIAGPDRG